MALHEAWHAAYAAYSGLQVLEVFCQEGAGYCEIAYPLVPTDLAAAYRDPQRAHAQLMVITGVICAQAMGEQKRFPGRAFPTSCGDAQLLARYEAAWAALPTRLVDYNRAPHVKPPWEAVLEQARAAVRAWYVRPGRRPALLALAGALAAAGHLDQAGWERLWRSPLARPLRFVAATGQKKYWITHPGDSPHGTCEQCAAIAAENADGVGLDEGFATGIPGDVLEGPPAHPWCRCTTEVR